MRHAAKRWAHAHRASQWAQRGIPEAQIMRVKYEELCTTPEATIRRVCARLGLSFEPEMLRLRKQQAHNIGGNPMRFRHGESKITLDERWREQLSQDELDEFERVAGRWNRRLGYLR